MKRNKHILHGWAVWSDKYVLVFVDDGSTNYVCRWMRFNHAVMNHDWFFKNEGRAKEMRSIARTVFDKQLKPGQNSGHSRDHGLLDSSYVAPVYFGVAYKQPHIDEAERLDHRNNNDNVEEIPEEAEVIWTNNRENRRWV